MDEEGHGEVIRFLTIGIAIVLMGYPPFLIYAMTVPVARFRTGSYVDFLAFAGTVIAIYGGALLGVVVRWLRVGRAWQALHPVDVFKAGVGGTLVAGVVFIVGSGLYGLMTQGSFEDGIGNLWGLVLVFALFFGALVSGGMALLFHSVRPSATAGRTRGSSGPGVRPGRSS